MSVADEPLSHAEGKAGGEGAPETVQRTRERQPYTIELKASTHLASLVPELTRQMRELGETHTLDLPCEVTCKVRVVFKSKVSKDDVDRLLLSADAGMWGLEVNCREGGEDDE